MTTIAQAEWRWFGNAGHLVASDDCRFHLATQVGRVLVSTIGDYKPSGISSGVLRENAEGFAEIGWQRFYETYVFELSDMPCPCGCDMMQVEKWSEIDSHGWQSRAEANRGHIEMCQKWATVDQEVALASAIEVET
jgi:hypothetical protein